MNRAKREFRLLWALGVPVLMAVSVLLLAACQSSDTPEPTATPTTSVSAPTATPAISGQGSTDDVAPTPVEADSEPEPSPTPEQATPEPTATSPAPEPTSEREIGQVEGVTFVVGEGSEATFTVEEKLARLPLPNDAVVRTQALTGEIHLDGRPSVINIDLHQLESDQDRRDRYIRQRMFPSHPVATLTVDNLLPLPPGFSDGETVTTQVTGTLDIRGIQAPVTFRVEARDDGDMVFVLGRTSFVWADFQMTAPNIGGFVQVTEEVSVEVLLAAMPSQLP
ncbi:MAG: YceI family protein [Dehalococcoidia bacterium]|nr:YceI family protein [Dehalococcoidia bacterium]